MTALAIVHVQGENSFVKTWMISSCRYMVRVAGALLWCTRYDSKTKGYDLSKKVEKIICFEFVDLFIHSIDRTVSTLEQERIFSPQNQTFE